MPGHPSFGDQGMPPPPGNGRGEFDFHVSARNKKLIGATMFSEVIALDTDGHGTHVASTVAGNFVPTVSFDGQAVGTASGMSPRAHLAIYQVDSYGDVMAAIKMAVKDGVDILSISMAIQDIYGGPAKIPFFQNAIVVGAFIAVEKGILVCCAAGNYGPQLQTLANDAPWIFTIGASTVDRKLEVTILLLNNVVLKGEAIYQKKNFPTTPLPLIYLDNEGFGLSMKNRIVVCETSTHEVNVARAKKVERAGGLAIIYINPKSEGEINSSLTVVPLPSAQISYIDGGKLRSYMRSTSPQAALQFKGTIIGDRYAPVVASFSSEGPSWESPQILKPDIIAPGVNILAASIHRDKSSEYTFRMMSGTSMACPHVSGIAALVKKRHPDWSPAAIRSAIMTTADTINLAGYPILDQTLYRAHVFAIGAGNVCPSRAVDPGLIYDIQPQEYNAYLYGLGCTDREVYLATGLKDRSGISGIPASQLNYPSFSVVFGEEVQVHTRTLTNVGEPKSLYTVKISQPPGVEVIVTPETLHFKERNEKITYSVMFRRLPAANTLEFTEGSLSWSFANYSVMSPIVVTMLN